jgi:hypothetical protein
MRKLIVRVGHDHDTESPNDNHGWRLVSFDKRHNSYGDPDRWFRAKHWHSGIGPQTTAIPADVGVAAKLRAGTAFPLSYHQHGNCVWSLLGGGPRCQWDTVDHAGIVFWDAPTKELRVMSYADRQRSAAAFLEEYTSWCNGDCFYYQVTTPGGEDIDGCGGIIGYDYIRQAVRQNLETDDELFAADADTASILGIDEWGEGEAEEYAEAAARELEA